MSFSITSVGYSKKIIYRNKAKLNDDVYITGNLGDSFIGLQILRNRIKTSKKAKRYFLNKYYQQDIQINLPNKLLQFANSSIDISDGLIADLEKMINKQKLSYTLFEKDIPISNYLSKLIKDNRLNKAKLISNGDDYQVLFTAKPSMNRIILNTSKNLGIKITKIGKINSYSKKSEMICQKNKHLLIKYKGYKHQF